MTEHNGFTNKATWRVMVEINENGGAERVLRSYGYTLDNCNAMQAGALAEGVVTEWVRDALADTSGLHVDLSMSALAGVDWDEIGRHCLEDWREAIGEE
jgi:hypothetical protein